MIDKNDFDLLTDTKITSMSLLCHENNNFQLSLSQENNDQMLPRKKWNDVNSNAYLANLHAI